MKKINVGKQIKTRRLELKLTQEQLAERSNSSVNFISQLERGEKQNITINKLSEIAEGLKINLTDLITYKVNDKIEIQNELNQLPAMPNTISLFTKLLSMSPKKAERISKSLLELINSIKK